ncbi:MAG: hypothetical protein WKG00_38170 [Polyangiaceae bacterium]
MVDGEASSANGSGGSGSGPSATGTSGTGGPTGSGGPSDPPEQPDCYDGTPLQCTGEDELGIWVERITPDVQLHFVLAYETHGEHSSGCHPIGMPSVHIARPGSHVLLLSTYEPAHWVVTADPGVQLQQVLVTGYSGASAEVPAGTTVSEIGWDGVPHDWPNAQGKQLAAEVGAVTNSELTTVHTAYCLDSVRID